MARHECHRGDDPAQATADCSDWRVPARLTGWVRSQRSLTLWPVYSIGIRFWTGLQGHGLADQVCPGDALRRREYLDNVLNGAIHRLAHVFRPAEAGMVATSLRRVSRAVEFARTTPIEAIRGLSRRIDRAGPMIEGSRRLGKLSRSYWQIIAYVAQFVARPSPAAIVHHVDRPG